MINNQEEDLNEYSNEEEDGFRAEYGGNTIEFGWSDERKVSGRRKKSQKKAKLGTFEAMGLSPAVLKGIRRKGFRLPTPIQRRVIPLILQGLDIVGMARTGSGKTAAFVIPLLEKLKAHSTTANGARACILSPTRELALQTYKVVQDLGRHTDLRTAVLVGGDSMEAQFTELASSPDILVATPGRLAHHLTEIKEFHLKQMEYVVFDEADRLFEMGFAEQLREILSGMSASRQTLLFSATMPRMLAEFARAGLKEPELVRLDTESKVSPELAMHFFTVREEEKLAALMFLLKEVVESNQSTILFAATRHHVEFLSMLLEREKIKVVPIHGAMDQSARKINMAKFKAKKAEVLVVTDVAARGLDIPLLDNVINYDFPPKPKLFVHRSGRVARAGRLGTSYNFVTREELGYLVDLHLFLGKKLTPAPIRDLSNAASQLNKISVDDANSETEFGCFPQTVLDPIFGHITELIHSVPDLEIQKRSVSNALKLYIKTRPPASTESARRAKEFKKEGFHPVLAAAVPSQALGGLETQGSLADITTQLRAYRPSQTVFEAQVASARAGQGAGMAATPGVLAAAPYERKLEVMKIKREAHSSTIASRSRENQMKTSLEEVEKETQRNNKEVSEILPISSGRFRDSSFYLSHEPSSGGRTTEHFLAVGSGDQFQDAVMDIGGEDAHGENQRRSAAWHWDTKSKRYVKLQKGEVMKAGKRAKPNISGPGLKRKKGNEGEIYQKWAKKTKMSIGKTSSSDANIAKAMGGRFKKGGRGWENPLKPKQDPELRSGARNELKSAEQVRKHRKDEQKKRERAMGTKGKSPKTASHKPVNKGKVKGLRVSKKK